VHVSRLADTGFREWPVRVFIVKYTHLLDVL
jgi:hypothetical protein